jgi:hypothetical protein
VSIPRSPPAKIATRGDTFFAILNPCRARHHDTATFRKPANEILCVFAPLRDLLEYAHASIKPIQTKSRRLFARPETAIPIRPGTPKVMAKYAGAFGEMRQNMPQ